MLEKRNLAKLAVVGVSLAVCTGAAFWDTGGETEALQVTEQAVTPVVALAQVYVSGEVVHPGIYQVPKGCRAYEAIKEAGGLTAAADKDRVNLARICKDGTHINVPALSKSKLKQRLEKEQQRLEGQKVRSNSLVKDSADTERMADGDRYDAAGSREHAEPGISEDSGAGYQAQPKRRGVQKRARSKRQASKRSGKRTDTQNYSGSKQGGRP